MKKLNKTEVQKRIIAELKENASYNYSNSNGKTCFWEDNIVAKPKWQLADEQLKKELIAEMHAADQRKRKL